jgi:iron complex outermembrane receptor protein
MRHPVFSFSLVFVCASASAQSDETIIIVDDHRGGIEELTTSDPRSADAAQALGSPTFQTRIRVDDRELENFDVASVLARSGGTGVRSLGGLGSFSSLSIRGNAPGQTAVLVDGVPLSRIASVTTDVGPFSMATLSEMSLARGGVPIEYGAAAQGGALELKTGVGPDPDGRPLRLSLGVGSFGARHALARWLGGEKDGSRGEHVALTFDTARGNFPFFHDGGTNLDPSDDHTERRRNNDYRQLGAVGRVRFAGPTHRLTLGGRGAFRNQGIPGSLAMTSSDASLETASVLLDADLASSFARASTGLRAWGFLERQRYRDVGGDVGLSAQDRRYLTRSAGLVARATWQWRKHATSAALDGQWDHFRETDLLDLAARPRSFGARLQSGLAIADDIELGRFRLIPAARIDILRTLPLADAAQGILGEMELAARTETFVSPRLSTRYRVTDAFAVKANAGRYSRAPTVLELFGDRGFVVGNPSLRAERGDTADVGVVYAPPRALGPFDRIYVETAAFATRAQRAIAFSSGGLASRAQNVGNAQTFGSEVTASARLGRRVSISGNYTWLDTRQTSGAQRDKTLPQRPAHDLYVRTDIAGHLFDALWVLWVDTQWVSENFIDVQNLRRAPARQLAGAGAKLALAQGLRLGLEIKNLTDVRVEWERLSPPPSPDLESIPRALADVGGFPLPGRSVFFAIEWEPQGISP